ncbi:hypothetical protein M8C21_013267, partial [Ambrosia artemisiifolia]
GLEVSLDSIMKFGKEFKQQKVPEWTDAYMDYNGLKRILHKVQQFRQRERPPTPMRFSQQLLYRPFSGLHVKSGSEETIGDVEDQVIAVETVQNGDSREVYNTSFLPSPKEGEESEVMFFEKLDEELNKVNAFYKDKVEEVVEEAASLNKQMNALIALRIKVKQPDIKKCRIQRKVSVDSSSTESSKSDSPNREDTLGGGRLGEEGQIEMISSNQLMDSTSYPNERDVILLDDLRSSIMTIALRRAARSYMKTVDDSYIGSSDEVTLLLDRVESTFTKYFANSNHREGMKVLRPKRKREKHRVFLAIFLCPFNILYKSSRLFLIRCLFHCICAPLYKVQFADFFLADQLTSQVQAMRCLEFYICYYGMRWYKKEEKCHHLDLYNFFYIIIAVIPYWVRFLQCVRRLFEEKDWAHLVNGSRYFLTIVAVVIRTVFELKVEKRWEVLALLSSVAAILFNTYWDIVVDWGLLQKKSKNMFLRNKLAVSRKYVYFVVMVLDVILRLGWLQLVLKFNIRALKGAAISTLFSSVEIFRRGVWMFFRLENEHLNNVGRYRAFKSVPLPFSYYEEEEKKNE